MAKENCGCEVQFDRKHIVTGWKVEQILYCPVHAAAFEMREALRDAVRTMKHDGTNNMAYSIARCNRALSLAEGKEADHGKPSNP